MCFESGFFFVKKFMDILFDNNLSEPNNIIQAVN